MDDEFEDPSGPVDYKAGYHEAIAALELRKRWITWILRLTVAAAAGAVMVAVSVVILTALVLTTFRPLVDGVTDLTQGDSPSGVSRRTFQAEQLFVLCSRTDNLVEPAKAQDIEKLCEGYSTLEEAYRTQGVDSPG